MIRRRPRPPVEPYPVIPGGYSRLARRVWWRAFELTPGVSLSATVRLRPALAERSDDLWYMLAAICRAASAALTLHPRLNFYTFWGELVWAGWPTRLGVVLELPDASCHMADVVAAHETPPGELIARLKAERANPPAPPPEPCLMRTWPLGAYAWGRLTGSWVRDYVATTPPLFISQLAVPEVDAMAFAPAHSAMLSPGCPQDGRMNLTICFNHQLANARPVARYLATIKYLLE